MEFRSSLGSREAAKRRPLKQPAEVDVLFLPGGDVCEVMFDPAALQFLSELAVARFESTQADYRFLASSRRAEGGTSSGATGFLLAFR